MLHDKRRYIVCLREGRIGANHVFVSVAAVAYVTGGAVRVLCCARAVHVLSIVSFIRIAERMYVCSYIRLLRFRQRIVLEARSEPIPGSV